MVGFQNFNLIKGYRIVYNSLILIITIYILGHMIGPNGCPCTQPNIRENPIVEFIRRSYLSILCWTTKATPKRRWPPS